MSQKLTPFEFEKVIIFPFSLHQTSNCHQVIDRIHITQKPTTGLKSTSDKSLTKQALCLTGLPNGKLKQQLCICFSVPLIVV